MKNAAPEMKADDMTPGMLVRVRPSVGEDFTGRYTGNRIGELVEIDAPDNATWIKASRCERV